MRKTRSALMTDLLLVVSLAGSSEAPAPAIIARHVDCHQCNADASVARRSVYREWSDESAFRGTRFVDRVDRPDRRLRWRRRADPAGKPGPANSVRADPASGRLPGQSRRAGVRRRHHRFDARLAGRGADPLRTWLQARRTPPARVRSRTREMAGARRRG